MGVKTATKRGWKLKSRILVWMLIISMLMTIVPIQQTTAAELPVRQASAAEPSGFQDVSPTDWFYDAVAYVQNNGIFSGTGVGIFSPKGTMTRAMYVTALGRMAGVDISEYSTSTFADVPTGNWYAPYVEWAVKKGIVAGTGGRNFSPDATVSREQMATLILRYYESYQIPYESSNRVATQPSDLADVSPWARDAVVKLWQAGLFVGDANGNFNPRAQASRAEAAVLFMRNNAVVEAWITQNQATPTPTPTPTPIPTPMPTSGIDGSSGNNSGGGSTGGNESGGGSTGGNNSGGNSGGSSNDSEYTIAFESNGGTAVTGQRVKHGSKAAEPEVPTKAGYTFGGWYSDSKLNISYSFTTTVTGNLTLYAKWMANYTVSFDSNGGSAFAARTVTEGEALSNLPAPSKEGYIFQGWFRDSDLSLIFAEGSTVTADTKLYAKYIDSVSNAVQSIPSYSAMDVAPGFTITVNDATGSLTAPQVKAGMTFKDIANPDFAGITVTGGNGLFTVASAAEDGKFVEGDTYQLTLTDDNLSFQGQDATTRISVFSVAKEEVMNVSLNPDMIYLPFAEVSNMMLNGAEVGSPAIPVVTATVGGRETGLAAANATSGTFEYTGSTAIRIGDTVAIYEGIRPDLRKVDTTGADDGDIAYVQITAINGNTYTYVHADAKQVLFKPDVLPVSIDADTDEDPYNRSIKVAHGAMNYSDSRYAPLGLSELTTVDVGDFIAFYEGVLAANGSPQLISYGRITSITPDAEMDVITYTVATEEDIKHAFDVYQKQSINGDQLLSNEEIAKLEDQIKQQAIASGFVVKAADYLSALAMNTKEVKAKLVAAPTGASKVKVENLTVVPSLGTTLKNIAGQTSGVSATLQIGADIVIRIHEESDLVIHMTGTFLQEISLNLSVNGATEWGEACVWVLCVPYPSDYRITANLDAYAYTGINIKAEMATVEHDKLQDALDDWLGEKNAGRLGKVLDIATEIQALINGVQDTEVDTAALKAQYKEMMENETDWVPLVKKKLFENSVRVVFGTIEINFTAEFVVSANVNLTIGADFNYTTAKRYSATVYVLGLRGTSDTVPLPGDGNYQFTFYVMGTIGLRAGILLELKAGIGSVKLNSIGISVEPGAYVNLWGYFYYQLKNVQGVRSSRSIGALIVEMGIYLESAVGAQLGDGLLSVSVPIYENTFPLYTIGEQKNVDDFAYSQDTSLSLNLAGSVTSIPVPEKLLTMSRFDLKTGDTDTKAYDRSRFDIQVDHPNFKYNSNTGKVEVVDKSIQVSEGNLVITWKGAPLSFTSHPLKRTIRLIWTARTGDYILQLDPRNGGATQLVAAPYNAAISVTPPAYPGYTFDGWYTAATGGTKMTIPSRMPAEDRTLYARWIANTNTPYTVQHYWIDPNTRTSTSPVYTETKTGTTGAEIRITSDRYRNQGYTDGTVSGELIKGDGSTVVKLYYYPTNRTMTFDLGYVGAPGTTVTEPFGKNIAARIPMPTRPGYTFAGWSPEVPGTMPNADTAYTANWTARADTPYQVVYMLQNIGSDTYTVADTESYRGTTGATANLTAVTLKSYEGFAIDLSVPGTVQTAVITGDGTTVLKVYYKRIAYAMTLDYNGAADLTTQTVNVPYGATTSLYLSPPAWLGHTFAGWSPAPPATMPAHNVTLTAQWTLNSFTVSFESNGGSAVNAQTVGYGGMAAAPVAPTKNGYVFGGWHTDSGLTTAYDFTTAVVTADVTVYAKWLHSYTVTFDSNGGSAVTSQTVNEGVRATAPVAPTLEGYVFSGWYSDIGLTIAYDFTTAVVTADLTLYAKWTIAQKNSYTVSFNSNGGTAVADQTVEEGAVAMAPPAPTKLGHTFDGWYSDSALTIAYGFTAPVTEGITLYANWKLNSYTVSFNSNGGSTVNSQPVNYGGTAAIPVAPTWAGYVFKGWHTDLAGTNAYDFAAAVTANLTLYAKWTAVYTVSFESNGGAEALADQTVEYGGTATAPAVPTKNGYTFGGWYSDSGWTNGYSFATPVTGNITLYAKWTSNSFTVSFNSNGGSAVTSQAVSPGSRAAQPAAPTWAGYTFDGWYTDLAGTNAYDFTTAVTADITLYAKWTVSAWRQVGDAMTKDYSIRLVFDSQGTPYVSAGGLYVKKYEQGAWRTIGGYDILGYGSRLKLAIDRHDVPYIVYYRNRTDELDAGTVVYQYNGTTWGQVGSIIPYDGNDNFIAFDSENTPYVVLDSLDDRVKVVKYNGAAWVDVSGGEELNRFGDNSIIAFGENDTPYLFYRYYGGDVVKWTLKKYEGGAWQTIGSEIISDIASFAIAPDGVPYVVYKNKGETWDAVTNFTVKRYDKNSSSWQTVGNSAFATGPLFGIGIDFDSKGTPYVAYQDATKGNKVSVVKYEGDWSYVSNGGFSAGEAVLIKLAIDDNDNIYVIYVDNSNGEKVTVMKYDPDWQPVTP